jgi:uncharacterized protein (TIGR02444 family)
MTDEQDFWDFSVSVYPRSRETCLSLQDGFGLDVNIVLFCCWRAAMGVELDEAEMVRILEGVKAWRSNMVEPLRAMRRWLKQDDPPDGAEELRDRILELELEGERLLQTLIIKATDTPSGDIKSGSDKWERTEGFQVGLRNLKTYQRAMALDGKPDIAPLFQELLDGVFAEGQDESTVFPD